MLSKSEIQDRLNLVAKGRLDMWSFHKWLQEASWNMHQNSSDDAMELVEDIKLAFEEYYQGRIDEDSLLACLAGIPIVYVSSMPPAESTVSILPYKNIRLPARHQGWAVA